MKEFQPTSTVLKNIDKYVGIAGKSGREKIYFLENGNVAYVRYSNINSTTRRPHKSYYFLVSKDRYENYRGKFILILICGSSERTLIIPDKDIEDLFKNVSLSYENKWYFYISPDLMLGDLDLSKYLNRWDFLKTGIENMIDKIRISDLRTKIYEIISGLSRQNKKCFNIYLFNDLYVYNFGKYEIYEALKFLEEKGTIYKIVYVDWYINIIYRKNGIKETDQLLLDIVKVIKEFSIRSNWQYGLKKSDLFDKLLEKGHSEDNINRGLKYLEEKKIIYKRSYIYWFTHDYTGEQIKTDIEDKEEVAYMPDKIEESELENIEEVKENIKIEDIKIEDIKIEEDTKIEEDIKIEDINIENEYSDISHKLEYLTKKWKELKYKKDKLEAERQKEIDLQIELDRKKEESLKRKKELEENILNIDKEKESLERLFEPIRSKYDQENVVIIEKKVKE